MLFFWIVKSNKMFAAKNVGKNKQNTRDNCYLERDWTRHLHLAVTAIAWETLDNWDILCEAQRGNREARWAILAARAKDLLADLKPDRRHSWNKTFPHAQCSYISCKNLTRRSDSVNKSAQKAFQTNLILAAWWYSLKPSLAASIFSCLRHLARLFWNQTWNIAM